MESPGVAGAEVTAESHRSLRQQILLREQQIPRLEVMTQAQAVFEQAWAGG
jgi:hypothetical protein